MTDITFASDLDVRLTQYTGDDTAIIQAMLVSTQGVDALEANASQGRINFLMRNRHGTPFEHNSMTFFVAAPIFVFREFHRHRIGFSYNEMSGRYKELPPKFYLPDPERPLVQIGKPGEYTYIKGTHPQYVNTCQHLKSAYVHSYTEYRMLLDMGVAKELARSVLPVAIFSEMFVTCNARSLMAFLSLRTNDPRATIKSTPIAEIEIVARKMESALSTLFPMTYESFNTNGRVAP